MKRINWINVLEQALGAILGTATIAFLVYLFNVVSGKKELSSLLWIGVVVLGIITMLSIFWRWFRGKMKEVGQWIIARWQLVATLVIVISGVIGLYFVTNQILISISILGASLSIFILTRSYYLSSQTDLTNIAEIKDVDQEYPVKVVSESGRNQKSSIVREWVQPVPGFKPIPLGNTLVNATTFPGVKVDFTKPRLGQDGIPFELNIEDKNNLIKGVEHKPNHYNDVERSREISPGAYATAAYVLVTSGSALRIVENVEFENRLIGLLEFYSEEFGENNPYQIDLVLGKNIRDWSYRNPNVVQTVSDPSVEQVWTDSSDQITIDMLSVTLPSVPVKIDYCKICSHIPGLPSYYNFNFPSIKISGLTYRIVQ